MSERFVRVYYVGLFEDDGSLKIGIPLYVKLTSEMSPQQEQLTIDTAKTLVRKYQKQITEYFEKLKNKEGENEKENLVSC